MFDHAQTECWLKQRKARSIVIVYQILCQSLLRRAWQGADSHRGRRAERRLAVPTPQAPLASRTGVVIVHSRSDGWMCVMSSLKKLREGASACVPVGQNGSLFGLAVHGPSAFTWTRKRLLV
jgi:hypothetical protein